MTGPKGNSEFCFPSNLNVILCFASRNIEGLTETNHTISLGVSQCHWLEQIHTKLPTLYNANYGTGVFV